MMTAWNTDSGESIYAEAIGKAWLKMGYDLQVFSFIKDDYHGEGWTSEDEDYVIRCFGTNKTNFLDPRPFLTTHYDVLVVQDICMLPKDNLAKIFHLTKKKKVHIFYDNSLSDNPSFYQFDWDAVVYFDERQKFLLSVYPDAKFIPFPCFPWRKGNKVEARKKLNLPLDEKIIYIFAQRGYYPPFLELTKGFDKSNPYILIVTKVGGQKFEPLQIKYSAKTIVREEEVLSKERFDDYLFASDALILHKPITGAGAVVSSTAFQALGAGCPILAPRESDFFMPFRNEVLKYGSMDELNENLLDIFQEGSRYKETRKSAIEFVNAHSPHNIAKKFIDLFESLDKK